MTDWRLAVATAVAIAAAATHSLLGERTILQPLLASPLTFGGPRRTVFVRLTLRFAWHVTSLFMLGCAAILAALAAAPPDLAAVFVLEISGAVFIVSAAITLSYSDGRHIGWPLLLIVGALCWWAAAEHRGGASIAATAPTIGLVVAGVLIAAAAIHVYWAVGGAGGSRLALPERNGAPAFRPGRTSTSLVALALFAAALLVAQQSNDLADWPPRDFVRAGCSILAGVFILRAIGDFRLVGLFKRVKDTSFALCDTAAYTPLCLLLGLAIAAVAL